MVGALRKGKNKEESKMDTRSRFFSLLSLPEKKKCASISNRILQRFLIDYRKLQWKMISSQNKIEKKILRMEGGPERNENQKAIPQLLRPPFSSLHIKIFKWYRFLKRKSFEYWRAGKKKRKVKHTPLLSSVLWRIFYNGPIYLQERKISSNHPSIILHIFLQKRK